MSSNNPYPLFANIDIETDNYQGVFPNETERAIVLFLERCQNDDQLQGKYPYTSLFLECLHEASQE